MSIQLIPAREMKLFNSTVGTKLVPMVNGTYWEHFGVENGQLVNLDVCHICRKEMQIPGWNAIFSSPSSGTSISGAPSTSGQQYYLGVSEPFFGDELSHFRLVKEIVTCLYTYNNTIQIYKYL